MRFRAARVRFLFDIDEQDSEYTRIVAELHQLRSASQLSGNRGAAPGLPSREAISEIVESLVSALYPPSALQDWTREKPMRSWLGRWQKRCPRSGMRSNWRWRSSKKTRAMRQIRGIIPLTQVRH
jgi:hypothetical protein